MIREFRYLRAVGLLSVIPLVGCLYRSHPVAPQISTALLQTATRDELIERINAEAAKVRTLKATVGITASVGGGKREKITEYREISGYILARKPSSLRIVGLSPILQDRMFDLASEGQEFNLWLAPRNQFIVGENEAVRPSAQPLENLQPRVIFDALLVQRIEVQNDLAVLEQSEDQVIDPGTQKVVLQPGYTLNIIKQNSQGWYLSRKTVFDRRDLRLQRQLLYDEHGSVATEVQYEEYKDFDGVLFPTNIQIWRPQHEYSIRLRVMKLSMNGPVTDDQFVVEPPPDARISSR